MKKYLNISLMAATMIAGSAVAATVEPIETHYPQNMAQPSTAPKLARADVIAQIPARGASVVNDVTYPEGFQKAAPVQAKTRDQVKAELAAAHANGTFMMGTINYPVSDD